MVSDEKKCPCGKGLKSDLGRVPRGFFWKIISFVVPIRRYRCYRCLKIKILTGDASKQALG